ncbi:MAG TPA: alpha-amylase family glycosyl hydrolase [Chryseolinea sp.]|nr:alpha-amylase family glycosyl hydrolase [Chryseolinea sp.]
MTGTFYRKLCMLMVTVSLFGCKSGADHKGSWPLGVKYEVFVLSYADGNGDGKGDFTGLTQKLDYLADLGIDGIWLMPIMKSPSYHKYDVTDYKSIHPDYGSVDDFKKFVAEAHRRNIKVIIDLILNHTGSDHPWFQSALKDPKSPYHDYYVWANKDSIREQISKKGPSFDSDNITQWHPVNGDTLADHYYGFFWAGMPDLNFDNPRVRNEFVDIGKFWLQDMGVDGFRFDAAKHIYPTERATDNHAFWQSYRAELEKINPNVYLVGEVWSPAKDAAPYLKGIPSLFNFDMGYAITATVNAGIDTAHLISKYKEINDYYKSQASAYLDATFLKNHDQNRILSELGGNKAKARIAAGILLTLPGTPYLYYGEEIGMLGMKPDESIREPFIWNAPGKDPLQTSWEKPKYSNSESVVPLSDQQNDQASLFACYKKLIHFRNDNDIMLRGSLDNSGITLQEVVSFKRTLDGRELLVLNNVSDVEVTLPLTGELSKFDDISLDVLNTAILSKGEIRLPAYSTVILN